MLTVVGENTGRGNWTIFPGISRPSLSQKTITGYHVAVLTFLSPANPGLPGKWPIKRRESPDIL